MNVKLKALQALRSFQRRRFYCGDYEYGWLDGKTGYAFKGPLPCRLIAWWMIFARRWFGAYRSKVSPLSISARRKHLALIALQKATHRRQIKEEWTQSVGRALSEVIRDFVGEPADQVTATTLRLKLAQKLSRLQASYFIEQGEVTYCHVVGHEIRAEINVTPSPFVERIVLNFELGPGPQI